MKTWKILWGLKFLVMIAAMVALFSYAVMALWNWLIPEIFNGPTITWMQSFGLLLLTKILFWAPRSMHYGGGRKWKNRHWKKKCEEKMADMTPEEREKCKQQFYEKCGWYGESAKEKVADSVADPPPTTTPS